jgi:hypothetical protein
MLQFTNLARKKKLPFGIPLLVKLFAQYWYFDASSSQADWPIALATQTVSLNLICQEIVLGDIHRCILADLNRQACPIPLMQADRDVNLQELVVVHTTAITINLRLWHQQVFQYKI